jgi:hypothetical protein
MKKKKVELKKLNLNKEKIMTLTTANVEKVFGGRQAFAQIPQSYEVCDSYDMCTNDATLKLR